MNVFEMLNLRSEFEELVLNFRIPGDRKFGTISNLKWFQRNARDKNFKKDGYVRARDIADKIVIAYTDHKRKK